METLGLVITGVAAMVLLITAPSSVVGWVLLAFVVVPAGDAAMVWMTGGPRWVGLGVQGATAEPPPRGAWIQRTAAC